MENSKIKNLTQQHSINFLEKILANPHDNIMALNNKSLKWKSLPDITLGDISVPVRHFIYQLIDDTETANIASYGYSDSHDKRIHNNKDFFNQLENEDYSEKIYLENTWIRKSSSDKVQQNVITTSCFHYAKRTQPFNTIKFSRQDIESESSLFLKRIKLYRDSLHILNAYDIKYKENFKINFMELIFPDENEIEKCIASIKSKNDTPQEDGCRVWFGKTKHQQDICADYLKRLLKHTDLLFTQNTTLDDLFVTYRENTQKVVHPELKKQMGRKFLDAQTKMGFYLNQISSGTGEKASIYKLYHALVVTNFESKKLNDIFLLMNTFGFLKNEMTSNFFAEIVENSSFFEQKNDQKLRNLDKFIKTFSDKKLCFKIEQYSQGLDEEIKQRKDQKNVLKNVFYKKDLLSIELKSKIKNQYKPTKNRKITF